MYVMCNLVIRTLTENAGMENHRLNSKAGKGRNRVKSRQGTAALRPYPSFSSAAFSIFHS